jgi:Family of unknown function (DUF6510)
MMGVFGHEMTTEFGTCASGGAPQHVGESRVYLRAPGVVAQCRQCGTVVMVFVEARGVTCVDLRGLATLDSA